MYKFASSLSLLAAAGLAAPSMAAVIYADDFTLAPAAAGSTDRVGFSTGWTEETGSGAIAVGSTGTAASFTRSDVANSPSASTDFAQITRTFSTVGFQDLFIDVTAYQSATTFEESFDVLAIQYSTDGVSFTNLLTDYGPLDTPLDDETTSGGTGPGNTDTANGSGLLAIGDALAENNPLFTVRLLTRFNASSESYFINRFELQGTAIPEPASLVLMSIGACVMLRRGSRA